jgi:hypothetical protein
MRKQIRKLTKKAGIGTPTILAITSGMVLMGMGLSSLTVVSDAHMGRTGSKAQATDLAESGIHILYDNIQKNMRINNTFPTTLPETDLTYTSRTGTNRLSGKYAANVISSNYTEQNVAAADGNTANRKTYTFIIEGIGRAVNGVESVVRAKFIATVDEAGNNYRVTVTGPQADGNGIPFSVCPGAIMCNAAIRMRTDAGIRTYSPNNDAHIVANRGIEWNPASGTKSSVTNPNVIDIQGQYQVPGSAEYAHIYDFTVGPSGIGNTGTKNYRSPYYAASGDNPSLDANTVARRQYPRPYPNETMFNQWQSEWSMQAAKGVNYASDLNSSSMPPDTNGWKILKAPVIIEGDLHITGGSTLRLMPMSDKPWENIVYVKGDVKNLGELKNLGVTLVFEGKYTDNSSAEYEIDAAGSMYGDDNNVMKHANLLSLNPDADAFKFKSDASTKTGLIYAAKGGIQVEGSPEFTGKLVAAGNQDIQIRPNGGDSFVVHYDPNSGGNRHVLGSAEDRWTAILPAGTVVKEYDPGRMTDWVQVK